MTNDIGRPEKAREEPRPPAATDRRHPAHGIKARSGQPTIVFVTVCTKGREAWLATPEVHHMPDHIHLFAGPGELPLPFDNWVRYWKSQFSRRQPNPEHRWETDHWDTRIRSAESYRDKWEYVRHNPVRRGLVTNPEDWPFHGKVFDLPW